MTYVVIKYFTDIQDNDYEYFPGMIYPRVGLKVNKERIKELSTKNNRRKEIFIAELEEREKPKKETKKSLKK
ncbi:hypothetical protein [Garciella nitratireducens]|uniref:Uncharacterized protein n=1 Tax=Garciella nitratireducens DSM 15102 TaxID=1121911 RepID=A0A1T4K6Q8_9FIRM|nr:hypothetical protein [Garciella nitratireducens]SJZ37985.1 hypothetical protein SAMN02745973_00373 [Garciella nitratireducens DSM 15102]